MRSTQDPKDLLQSARNKLNTLTDQARSFFGGVYSYMSYMRRPAALPFIQPSIPAITAQPAKKSEPVKTSRVNNVISITEIQGFNRIRKYLSDWEEKSVIKRFQNLNAVVDNYSIISPRVKNGLFAGRFSKDLRRINNEIEKVKSGQCTIAEGVAKIIEVAQTMGDKHPILIAANKCSVNTGRGVRYAAI